MFAGIPLTLGIEEEYQIVHPDTRDLHSYMQQFLNSGRRVLPAGGLRPEFMASQAEMASHICADVQELRTELTRMRHMVCELAKLDGLIIVAASTHPFAKWTEQDVMEGDRYRRLLDDFRAVAQQLLVFGMHIHVGFGDAPGAGDLMIEVMNQLRYFLPHILALSTSSPFWQGRDTGLKSYRSVIFEMMPRTGIPLSFKSFAEYQRFVDTLAAVGSLSDEAGGKPDATKIWWDVRPHPQFGTLEVRISDICTRMDDAVSLAALIQAIVALLIKLRRSNQSWRAYRHHHLVENKWRAIRYGAERKLIDFGLQAEVAFPALVDELVDLLDNVVDELGSRAEVEHIRNIVRRGTSAQQQRRVYARALREGGSNEEALHAVVDHLAKQTMMGVR
jgi:carboxylate-amine ligase